MGLSFAFNLKPPRAVNKCICLAKSFLGRNWCWFIGISVCKINQATVFWQNSNEVEWIVINSLEGANHGHIPHNQSSHWPQWRTGARVLWKKKVNCHFCDGGHLERLRFSVFGSAPIWNFVGLVIQPMIHSVAAPLDSKNIVYKTQPGQTNSLDCSTDWCSI